MVDVAKPAPAKAAAAAATTKPERPDEEQYKVKLAKAEKELKAAEEKIKQLKAKIDIARPQNKDSPALKRQQELRAELSEIRSKQQSSRSGRTQVLDKIKRLDENLKSRIAESKKARGKVQYRSVEDVEKEIDRLQSQVDSGKLKIVDEKKALADISQLNRIKKSFANFDDAQKGIDEVKAQIAELKKSLDDPEWKALNDRYTQITTELDAIKAEQDDAFTSLNTLRDERNEAYEDQQKKYAALKEIKGAYIQQRRAAVEYEREARRIRDEKRQAENEAYHRSRRQETAKAKLDDASVPAYQDEIRITQALLAHLDPSSISKQEVAGPGVFAAAATRTVDASGIKGTALKKKVDDDEDNYFVGHAGKKKKGGRKGNANNGTASPAVDGRFSLDLGTIDSLGKIGVDPPMSQAEVPAVVEKLKEKLEFWKTDQDRKTKENIDKAQAEIDRLEAEAKTAGSKDGKSASENQVNGGSTSAGAEQDTPNENTDGGEKTHLEEEGTV